MSQTQPADSSVIPATPDLQPFTSLDALREVHDALLDALDQDGESSALWAQASTLLMRTQKTGALLDASRDRRAAQSILDYWSGLLYRAGQPVGEARLAEFDPTLAPELPDEPAPYRGLEAFQELQHDWFFGRQVLLNKLADQLRDHRFVAVVGASGSGKSSLVLAGLLPALKAGELSELPDSATWRFCTPIVPTAEPLVSLTRAASSMAPSDLSLTEAARFTFAAEAFRREPGYLAVLATESGVAPVCLVIDQFEEIFTLCTDDAARAAFVDNLLQVAQGAGQHRVVVTMRSDYEDNVARLPALAERFQQSQVRVTALSAGELREAIEEPAKKVGLKFDEGVVDALLGDILGEPAGLPLLQFALLELWRTRNRNRITWTAYKQLGNAREGLARTADRLYDELPIEDRETVRRLLLRMVRPGVGSEMTSSRVPRAALHTLEASDRVDRVLNRLNQAGLLRVTRGETHAQDVYEVAHEALVRNWPRLLGWLDEAREAMRQRNRLLDAAQQWQQRGREPSGLLRGQPLDEAEHIHDLSGLEAEFVATSRAEVNRELTEQEATRQRALEQRLRADEQARVTGTLRQRARILAAALSFAVLMMLAAIFLWVQSTQIANQNAALRVIADSRALAAQAKSQQDRRPDLGLLLGIEATQVTQTIEARGSLLDIWQANLKRQFLQAHTSSVLSVAFSPDGKTLASASYDTTIILWDMADPKAARPLGDPLKAHTAWVLSVAFSPDGKTLASASDDNTIILWDVADPKAARPLGDPLKAHTAWVYSVAFSPDGKTLASASADNTIILWDVADPKAARPLGDPLKAHTSAHTSWVYSVAFSPDGKTLASASDDTTIILWDVADPKAARPLGEPLKAHTAWVLSVAFSPDGKTLASASDDNTIILWDVADPKAARPLGEPLKAHTDRVYSVAFSPDGKTLASASYDTTIIMWDVADPKAARPLGEPLKAHTDRVYSVAFSPDGKTLASASYDTTIILWDMADPKAARPLGDPLKAHTAWVLSVAFSPDGKTLASASDDNTIILWDVADPKAARPLGDPLKAHTQSVLSVAFSPDGKTLASASADNTIILWDVADPKAARPLGDPLKAHTQSVLSVAFSPDGKTLASASDDNTIILWDVADPKAARPLGDPLKAHTQSVLSVAFSPDGKTLASASADTTIIMWDVADPKAARPLGEPLKAHTQSVLSVAFSPDGKTLASASADTTIILWDVADPKAARPLGEPLKAHASSVRSVAFSPDGKTLASASYDNTIILWDVADPKAARPLGDPFKAHTQSVLSVAFSPDGKTLASGGGDRRIRLTPTDPAEWAWRACAIAGRNLTQSEWRQYMGNLPYRKTCPQWPGR